jgi:hypothetical protein
VNINGNNRLDTKVGGGECIKDSLHRQSLLAKSSVISCLGHLGQRNSDRIYVVSCRIFSHLATAQSI